MDRMLLVLRRGADQEAALRTFLDQQQVKSSASFHHWVTPAEFGQQYGPADSDVQAVTQWLGSQGFRVTNVAAGRTVIEFSGTAGLVRQVLGTEIHRFHVNGADYWANASDPQIPAALAPVVAGFDSLNNFPVKSMSRAVGTFRRNKATGVVQPLFTYPMGGGALIALGPTDFATIYNVLPLWNNGVTGTGQTIAVVGQTNINLQDVRDFRSMFGLPANDPQIILNGPDPGITSGDEEEADLDVEWSGAVAQGATIDFVVSQTTESTQGVDLSSLYIVDNNLAPVMSISYGGCEAEQSGGWNAFRSNLWEQAAAQGITVLVSSGDSGSAGCDSTDFGEIAAEVGLGVNGMASTPFNVAVGGTDFNDIADAPGYWSLSNASPGQNSALSYIPEMAWNDSCGASGVLTACSSPDMTTLDEGAELHASGGGVSSCVDPVGVFPAVTCNGGGFAKPSWQHGPGVPSDGVRDVPDVSLFAGDGGNASFYVICDTDANAETGGSPSSCDLSAPFVDFQGVGGTSASVQVFAGIMALVNQVHGRQGNANYVFYPMAAAGANNGTVCASDPAAINSKSCIFYDINNPVGSAINSGNSVICYAGTPNCSNNTPGPNAYGIMVSGNSPAYSTGQGYDLVTGLGTVNAANLVNNWTSSFTATTTSLTLTPTTVTHGQPVNVSVNVTTGSGTPTGDVSLIAQSGSTPSNQTGIGPFTLSSGSFSGSTNSLPGGSYNVTAHYSGDGKFGSSDSSPVTVTVNKESSLSLLRLVTQDPATGNVVYTSGAAAYGSGYLLRTDVTNSSGNLCANLATGAISYPCPTGTLTVNPPPTDLGAPVGNIPGHYTVNSQGNAEDQNIQLAPGTYSFTANYSGDSSYQSSQSNPLQVTISLAQTSASISGVPQSTVAGTTLTITGVVATASDGASPTGTLQLLNNGSPLGNPVVVVGSFGAASAPASAQGSILTTLPVGSNSVSVRYSGDANYAPSTSVPVPVTVADFSVSASPSSISISTPGATGSAVLSITPISDFTGTVTLTVAGGCPTGATCTFSPSSVAPNGVAAATSTLTITTSAPTSLAPKMDFKTVPPAPRFPVGVLSIVLGLLAIWSVLVLHLLPRWRPALMIVATVCVIASLWIACGGTAPGGNTQAPIPAVNLSTAGLTFPAQSVGTSSSAQNIILSNTGTATLAINGLGLTGANAADYSQINNCGGSVAAGANCSIGVTFSPTGTGARNASVTISDNANGSPHSVALTGTGVGQPTPAGTYPVAIFAASGADSHNITVNVVVQ
jgi:subtilase family serine protease